MPYIKSNDGRREKLQNGDTALNAGELNYQIFYYYKYRGRITESIETESGKKYVAVVDKITIKDFVDQFLGKKPNYQKYNDMTGCLVRCAKEVKRRLGINADILIKIMDSYDREIDLYENEKIVSNGDV